MIDTFGISWYNDVKGVAETQMTPKEDKRALKRLALGMGAVEM